MLETLDIIDMGMDAVGIAKNNGKVYFVPFALVGEKVQAQIVKDNKNFAQAKLNTVLSASVDRVEPPCPYYYECGGCNLQHSTYTNALNYKTNYVKTLLKKNANLDIDVLPTIASDKEYAYRNKAVFNIANINGKTVVGMYCESSHKTIRVDKCMLDDGFSEKLIKATYEFVHKCNLSGYDRRTNKGLLKGIMIRKLDDKYLIVLVATNRVKQIHEFVTILNNYFDNFGLFVNYNTQNTSLILTDKYEYIYGLKNINSTFVTAGKDKIEYTISPHSFMQVNNFVKDLIYNKVAEICHNSDYVVDAYSGAGLLSAILSTSAKQVYGLEIVKSATEDADRLKNHNNIKNLTNINTDCAVGLPNLYKKLDNAQFYLILDPPRKGVDPAVVDATLQVLPQKIVYISCNPATLGRDLKSLMSTSKYKVDFVQPYDMFPQTGHVETLVVLSKI